MLLSWLIASGTASCSSHSAPPPVTGTSAPAASRRASSNTCAFSTVTVSAWPAGAGHAARLQLKQVPWSSSFSYSTLPAASATVTRPPVLMPG